MNINLQEVIITIVVSAITVAVTFYVKDFLQQRNQYLKLRKKLEKIAGKNARIIYEDNEIYKITDIDENGITLQNELKTLFIPAQKLLQSEIVLPSDNYEKIKGDKKIKEEREKAEVLTSALKNNLSMPNFDEYLNRTEPLMHKSLELEKQNINNLDQILQTLSSGKSLQTEDPLQILALKLAKTVLESGFTSSNLPSEIPFDNDKKTDVSNQ